MSQKNLRKLGLIVLLLISVAGLIQLSAHHLLTRFLTDKLPHSLQLSYTDIAVNVLTGKVELLDVKATLRNKETSSEQAYAEMKHVRIEGFSIWRFLFNRSIHAELLELAEPHFCPYSVEPNGVSGKDRSNRLELPTELSLDRISITDGKMEYITTQRVDTTASIASFNFHVNDFSMYEDQQTEDIPFHFTTYQIEVNKLVLRLSEFERLHIEQMSIIDQDVRLTELSIHTQYNPTRLSSLIQEEHEHLDLRFPSVQLKDLEFGMVNNRFLLASSLMEIDQPNLNIFLDKTLPDRKKKKHLYSTSVRELDFDLHIDSIHIDQTELIYTELLDPQLRPGELRISGLDIDISGLNNSLDYSGLTTCTAQGRFMDTTPMELSWEFSVQDSSDRFLVRGSMIDVDETQINPLLEASYRTRMSGDVDRLYFSFTANPYRSNGDFKMRHDGLKMVILDKQRNRMNHFLTALSGILMAEQKPDLEGYRYGEISAERDPTKSFFNYLWLSIRSGIQNTLTARETKTSG